MMDKAIKALHSRMESNGYTVECIKD
jgi:hypothetical protein